MSDIPDMPDMPEHLCECRGCENNCADAAADAAAAVAISAAVAAAAAGHQSLLARAGGHAQGGRGKGRLGSCWAAAVALAVSSVPVGVYL